MAFSKISAWYKRCLTNYPVLSQGVQTSILMAAGDVIAQKCIEGKTNEEYSLLRTLQFSSVGIFYVGPVLTNWYGFLARTYGSGGGKIALKKMLTDQTFMAPIFIGGFLICVHAAQFKGIEEIKTLMKRDYVDIMMTNYTIWPAVQLFNFYAIPVQHQVLLVQFVALFWNTYLSWKTQKQMKEK